MTHKYKGYELPGKKKKLYLLELFFCVAYYDFIKKDKVHGTRPHHKIFGCLINDISRSIRYDTSPMKYVG